MPAPYTRWSKIRRHGAFEYVLLYGVLGWGFTWGLLFTLSFPSMLHWLTGQEIEFLDVLLLTLVLFPMGGAGWAYVTWLVYENGYSLYGRDNESLD